MKLQIMPPYEINLTLLFKKIFEKDIPKQEPLPKISWYLDKTQQRDLTLVCAGCVGCMVLMYQIDKRNIKERTLDCLIFRGKKFIKYLESLSSTHGQEGCGATRKTEEQVEEDLQKSAPAVSWYKFWKRIQRYCFLIRNSNSDDAIIILSDTALELTTKTVIKEGTVGAKVGVTDITNAAADVKVIEKKEYTNARSISVHTIQASKDEEILSEGKDLKLTILFPSKSDGLYFCHKQNVCHNAKYWNYEIPNVKYNGTQPVVEYDGFSIAPHSPNKIPTCIISNLSAETSETSSTNSITSQNS